MTESNSEQKRFTDDLDRLLAGQAENAGDTSYEYRAMMEVARGLINHRGALMPTAREHLKQKLLRQLESLQRESPHSHARPARRPWRLLLTNSAWRTVTVTAAALALAFLATWQSGVLGQPGTEERATAPSPQAAAAAPPATLPTPPPPPPLAAQAAPSFEANALTPAPAPSGAEIRLRVTFLNTLPQPAELAPFPPRFRIARPGDGTTVRLFAPGTLQQTVPAYGTASYTLVWDQKDDQGRQVGPGTYLLFVDGLAPDPKSTRDVDSGALAEIVIRPQ